MFCLSVRPSRTTADSDGALGGERDDGQRACGGGGRPGRHGATCQAVGASHGASHH